MRLQYGQLFNHSNYIASNGFFSKDFILFLSNIDSSSNMQSVAVLFFTEYYAFFLISSFHLLLAMVGTITLVLCKTFRVKSQKIAYQTLETFTFFNF